MEADVIVVGGGISGLTAARHLNRIGAKVIVLEGRDRVGGRTYTKELDGFSTDLGGAYVGPGQNRVLKILRDFDLKTYVVPDTGKFIINEDGKKVFANDPSLPPLGLLTLLDINWLINETDRLANTINLQNPLMDKQIEAKYDTMSVQQWVDSCSFSDFASKLFCDAVRTLLCTEPSEISMAYWMLYVKSGECFGRLTSTTNGAQERKVIGGTQQISGKLAENLQVEFNSGVVHIDWRETEKQVKVKCENGKVYTGSYCIIAFSPTLYNKIQFEPILPAMKSQLSQRMPMGSIIKTVMFYEKPFWREKGLRGQMIWNKGPVIFCIDDTKPDGSHPAIMGFILSRHARDVAHLTPEERKNKVCQQYHEAFGLQDALNPVDYQEMDWSSERFSGGCYVGYMPPGVMSSFYSTLREPMGRIHFAGTETATQWIGYMDGAIQAGERAAYEIYLKLEKETQERAWGKMEPPKEHEQTDPEINKPFDSKTLEKLLPSPKGLMISVLVGVAAICVARLL